MASGRERLGDDPGGEDVVLTKQRLLFAEDTLDPFSVQPIREGKSMALEKRFGDGTRTVSCNTDEMWLL